MKSSIRKVDGPRDYVAVPNKLMSDVPNLNGDWLNFYLLILLYIIQGFPIGLSGAFPIILQSKKLVTYEEQVSINVLINILSMIRSFILHVLIIMMIYFLIMKKTDYIFI